MLVQPSVEFAALVQNSIAKSEIRRPLTPMPPLAERASRGEHGQLRVARKVVAIRFKAIHGFTSG